MITIQGTRIDPGGILPGDSITDHGQVNSCKCSKFSQVIRLMDVNGNSCVVRWSGQMQTTSHTLLLQALSHHAGSLYVKNATKVQDWSIDEMGMLDISGLDFCKENDILQQEINKLNPIPVLEEVL